MNELDIKKNIMDLEHSVSLSKGITSIAIAVGGFVTVLSVLSQKDLFLAIVLAAVFALLFLGKGMIKLKECGMIKERIKRLVIS